MIDIPKMSESNLSHTGGIVVGTAGHIDHGKTTLVHALTGMNTDTLKEEQRRGISIDLGFANLRMPDCPPISFVDVPGHERFVKNMLAGAGGMEAVLLIVAANESVKPQTREHFDICRLLAMRRGIVVLTKADLATPAQLDKTSTDVKALVAKSFLENAPVIVVSAVTQEGMPKLRQELSRLASTQSERDSAGILRLPVDRSFARKGFGAVVTGTLASGILRVGDAVAVYPQKASARIRGLQVHHSTVQSASAGQRVAVNLTGIEQTSIRRGNVIAPADVLEVTRILDVRLEWLDASEIPARRQEIFFHSGTSEILGTVKMHDQQMARIRLKEPVMILPGDRFVLRRPSPAQTIAGGVVVDSFPPRSLSRVKTITRLTALQVTPQLSARIRLLVDESRAGLNVSELVRVTGAPASMIQNQVSSQPALVMTAAGLVLAKRWLEEKRYTLTVWLTDFHAKSPGAAGAPLSLARMGMEPPLADAVFSGFAAIRIQGDLVSLTSHRAAYSAADTQIMQNLEQSFRSAAFQPPSPTEALEASAGGKRAIQLLEVLIKSKRLVRISADLIFHVDVITHIRESLAQHKGRKFTVAEFKSWMNISRRYAIPLLEYLDSQKVTRRDGDMRVVL